MALDGFLKQSTAVTVKVGPFVDDADGNAEEGGLTIAQADVRLSKNAGNFAQKGETTTLAHDELGIYDCLLSTTDTGTLGILQLAIHESGALIVQHTYMILPANIWDSWFGADKQQVDVVEMAADVITAAVIANAAIDAATFATDAISATSLSSAAVDKIVDQNWEEAATDHETADSMGQIMASMAPVLGLTVATPSGASLPTDLAATEVDLYQGQRVVMTSGTQKGASRIIRSYGATGIITLSDAFETDPGIGDEIAIQPAMVNLGSWRGNHVNSLNGFDVQASLTQMSQTIVDAINYELQGTADSGTATTLVDAAALTQDDDYWNGSLLEITDGTLAGQVRPIVDFDAATDTITVDPPFTVAVATHKYGIAHAATASSNVTAMADNTITAASTATDYLAEIQVEAAGALSAIFLDNMFAIPESDEAVNGSYWAQMISATSDASTHVPSTDSLEAIAASGGGGPTAEAIADAVWDEVASGHLTVGTTGQLINASGSVTGAATTGATTTIIPTDASETTSGHFVGQRLMFTEGPANGEARVILFYDGSGEFTVARGFTTAPADTNKFVIQPSSVNLDSWLGSTITYTTAPDVRTAQIATGAIAASAFAAGAISAAALSQAAADKMIQAVSGTAETGSTTTTILDTANRTESVTDYWVGSVVVMTSGSSIHQARRITAFNTTTDTITVDTAFKTAIANNDTYIILRTQYAEAAGAGSFWSGTEQSDIRDALGVTGAKTTATGGQLQDVKTTTDEITFGTANRVDVQVFGMENNVMTAAAANADLSIEIRDAVVGEAADVWAAAARTLTGIAPGILATDSITSGTIDASFGDEVAAAVWDEAASTRLTLGSMGQLLNALTPTTGTVSDAGPAAGDFDTAGFTEATNNHFDGHVLIFTDASSPLYRQARIITTYTGSGQNCAFDRAFTEAPANGDEFAILGPLAGGLGRLIVTESDGMAHADVKEHLGVAVPAFVGGRYDVDVGDITGTSVIALAQFDGAAIDSTVLAANSIGASQIATGAIDATAMAAGAIATGVIASAARNEIADSILVRSCSNTDTTHNQWSIQELILARFEFSTSGVTQTVKETDGSTTYSTRTATVDSGADPIIGMT